MRTEGTLFHYLKHNFNKDNNFDEKHTENKRLYYRGREGISGCKLHWYTKFFILIFVAKPLVPLLNFDWLV